jgi:hypothetical protein
MRKETGPTWFRDVAGGVVHSRLVTDNTRAAVSMFPNKHEVDNDALTKN